MGASRKRLGLPGDPHEQEIREQEVLRANKELAAYFKGRRTEREARAAVKIIKAFIRHRERLDPAKRRPLFGESAKGKPNARAQDTRDERDARSARDPRGPGDARDARDAPDTIPGEKKPGRRGERRVRAQILKSPIDAGIDVDSETAPIVED